MIRRIAIIIVLLLPIAVLAQKKKAKKIGWQSITAAGFAAGESGVASVFQWSGGLTYDRYFTGIGFGYNRYGFDAFPLFADWRLSFGRRKLGFAYVNPGYSFPKHYKSKGEPFRSDEVQGGFYIDAGVGYRIPLGLLHRLSFSAGYVRKSIVHEWKYTYPCGIMPCVEIPPTIYVNHYKYGLITTKLSWELGK